MWIHNGLTSWIKGEVGNNNNDDYKERGMSSTLESLPEASGVCNRCAEEEEGGDGKKSNHFGNGNEVGRLS